MNDENNTQETVGWFTSLIRRLFHGPVDKWPETIPKAKRGMVVHTDIQLPFADRLRVLVSGRIKVETLSVWKHSERYAWNYSAITIEPPLKYIKPELRPNQGPNKVSA